MAEWTPYTRFAPRIEPVDGEAHGLDVRLEVRRAAFYARLGYGLSEVWYDASRQRLAVWYGPIQYHPPHDRRHQFDVLAAYTRGGFSASVRWQYGSGLPYSRPAGFDEFILMDHAVDPFTEPGDRRAIYSRPFNARLPAYHRLDVSVEQSFDLGIALVTLHGALLNVYDRANVFHLDLFTGERTDQLPLFPVLGLNVAFP